MGTSRRLVDGSSFPHWKTLRNIHSTVLNLLNFIMFLQTNKNIQTYTRRKWQFMLWQISLVNMAADFSKHLPRFQVGFRLVAQDYNTQSRQSVTTRVLARESNEPEGQDFELKENSFSDWRRHKPTVEWVVSGERVLINYVIFWQTITASNTRTPTHGLASTFRIG